MRPMARRIDPEQVLIRALGLERAVVSAVQFDAGREPATVYPGGELRADERRDPRLVRGEVGGGDALAPLAGSAAAEEGVRVLPTPLRPARRDVGTALAHPGQAHLQPHPTRRSSAA